MKRVVISQPRYLPAINYLQRLRFADEFVILDNVQRQGRGFENRNKILAGDGESWLTIPISSSSRALICDTRIDGTGWIERHKKTICSVYANHPFYDKCLVDRYYGGAEAICAGSDNSFTEVVAGLLMNACGIFGFKPNIVKASCYRDADNVAGPKKLLKICQGSGATAYISGPNGREYGVKDAFSGSGIDVLFHDYEYPVYEQFGQAGFYPWLAFFDPLFNLGPEKVRQYMECAPALAER